MNKGRLEAFSDGVLAIIITIMVLELQPPGGASGEAGLRSTPVASYGLVLILSAIAYFILVRALIALHGQQSDIAQSIGRDLKGKISIVIYLLAVIGAFIFPPIAIGLYVLVAAIWFIPDRRFEEDSNQP